MFINNKYRNLALGLLAGVLVCLGLMFRFYHITDNDFVFYDEGYYLNYNRQVMQTIADFTPQNFKDVFDAFGAYVRSSLAGAKALWFLIINFRVYCVGFAAWFFPRVVSAVAGSLTVGLVFLFARRFYQSGRVGALAAVILAFLPGHVFYSRLGLQEATSTLLVLTGFYLYLFPRRFGWRSLVSAVFLAAAFFTNYRLIVLPVLILASEAWLAFAEQRAFHLRRYVWHTVVFFSCVFLIGGLDGGKNTYITFGWMFHQANLAQGKFAAMNLLSFPYYLFRLENAVLALFFFGNIFLLVRRRWLAAFPFVLALLTMVGFSFASERGARYLCVMYPFIAMSAAYLIYFLLTEYQDWLLRTLVVGGTLVMVTGMYLKAWGLTKSVSDYRSAAEFVLAQGPAVRFVSTQNYVQNLYVRDAERVAACPARFEDLARLNAQGYTYLVLDPQAYVSYSRDNLRFAPQLDGYLEFVRRSIEPVRVFPHFNHLLLERFVFDHNENLLRSIRFLAAADEQGFGQIRVYDLPRLVNQTFSILSQVPQRGARP